MRCRKKKYAQLQMTIQIARNLTTFSNDHKKNPLPKEADFIVFHFILKPTLQQSIWFQFLRLQGGRLLLPY